MSSVENFQARQARQAEAQRAQEADYTANPLNSTLLQETQAQTPRDASEEEQTQGGLLSKLWGVLSCFKCGG